MDKQKIELKFSEIEKTKIEHKYFVKKDEIEFEEIQYIYVKPYLNLSDRQIILNAYFEAQEKDPILRHVGSEIALIVAVLAIMTNVDYEDIANPDRFITFMDSGLWYKIKSAIVNFNELKQDIDKISSLDNKISRITAKLEELLKNISNIDLSQEGISELLKELDIQKKKLGEVFPQVKDKPSHSIKKKKKSSEIVQDVS